jgi:hypothetical protein
MSQGISEESDANSAPNSESSPEKPRLKLAIESKLSKNL